MLTFKTIDKSDLSYLSSLYKRSVYKISDYSLGIKYMWRDMISPAYCISDGCLLVYEVYEGVLRFNLPLPIDESANISSALMKIEEYCKENFIPLEFDYVPKEGIRLLTDIYDRVEISSLNILSDYLYLRDDFASFSGRKYSGQRNHIKKFNSAYPSASFRILEKDDMDLARDFFVRFKESFGNASDGAYDELLRAESMCEFVGGDEFICGGYEYEGKLISFCLCEICGNMAINHIEKAFSGFEGLYPATANQFAKVLPAGIIYLNREDDAGIRGLRISKLQYQPCDIVKKYAVKVRTELSDIDEVPRLFTNRLVLDRITRDDAKKYFSLSTDERINRYWGYDYRESCEAPEDNFFYEDQKKDFENRMALNFAIRYKGRFAGEVILYNFDYRDSSAEAGIRIFCDYDGKGIGNEAFGTVCSYALYTLGLSYVKAKCYKENLPSAKMLQKSMKLSGEDEKFFYFTRKI